MTAQIFARAGGSAAMALVMAASLAGCSGGSGTVSTTPATLSLGASPNGAALPSVSYDKATDQVTLSSATGPYATLPRYPAYDSGDFHAYVQGSNAMLRAESPSGDLSAAIFQGYPSTYSTGMVFGSLTTRNSAGTIPTSGTASYSGKYLGLAVVDTTGFPAVSQVTGDAHLTADFAGSTVSGSITNRVFSAATSAKGDVTLESGKIGANGTFSGLASGGEFGPSSTSTDVTSGSYNGLFGGNNGSEAAGNVVIHHVLGSPGSSVTTNVVESGAFIATQ